MVLPTIHDRVGDSLYIHGSRSNRMLRCMTAPTGACVTVTLFDGLVLARSVFNHSINYRSAVVFGRPVLVEDPPRRTRRWPTWSSTWCPGARPRPGPPTSASWP